MNRNLAISDSDEDYDDDSKTKKRNSNNLFDESSQEGDNQFAQSFLENGQLLLDRHQNPFSSASNQRNSASRKSNANEGPKSGSRPFLNNTDNNSNNNNRNLQSSNELFARQNNVNSNSRNSNNSSTSDVIEQTIVNDKNFEPEFGRNPARNLLAGPSCDLSKNSPLQVLQREKPLQIMRRLAEDHDAKNHNNTEKFSEEEMKLQNANDETIYPHHTAVRRQREEGDKIEEGVVALKHNNNKLRTRKVVVIITPSQEQKQQLQQNEAIDVMNFSATTDTIVAAKEKRRFFRILNIENEVGEMNGKNLEFRLLSTSSVAATVGSRTWIKEYSESPSARSSSLNMNPLCACIGNALLGNENPSTKRKVILIGFFSSAEVRLDWARSVMRKHVEGIKLQQQQQQISHLKNLRIDIISDQLGESAATRKENLRMCLGRLSSSTVHLEANKNILTQIIVIEDKVGLNVTEWMTMYGDICSKAKDSFLLSNNQVHCDDSSVTVEFSRVALLLIPSTSTTTSSNFARVGGEKSKMFVRLKDIDFERIIKIEE